MEFDGERWVVGVGGFRLNVNNPDDAPKVLLAYVKGKLETSKVGYQAGLQAIENRLAELTLDE